MENGNWDGTASTERWTVDNGDWKEGRYSIDGHLQLGPKICLAGSKQTTNRFRFVQTGQNSPKKKPNKEPAESIVSTGRVHFEKEYTAQYSMKISICMIDFLGIEV